MTGAQGLSEETDPASRIVALVIDMGPAFGPAFFELESSTHVV